ncbi:ABC transporter ATP-binding protein [Streptomyces sp. CRN 30]|uniref:ABC transporter ATP-binding protein n=1 Tax=Streptomyces sp. CRN 30 TaxID=3075613 RepID=UPI002A7FDB38|nr:ABC transporter ATP-binding protein [Streptomyces sp. CRN 30]
MASATPTAPDPGGPPLLEVAGLGVAFGGVPAVRDATWSVRAGEIVGLVGESGSGKSATGLAVLGLHGPAAEVTGSVRLAGLELAGADEETLRAVRGRRVSMVFQDALDALNPYRRVGDQIAEAYRLHHPDASRGEARGRAVEMLARTGIDRPEERAREYPHQFSGGMRQRVMIALALVNEPELIIADEPTTALDATVQAQVLQRLVELQQEMGLAVVLITHDFGVVERVCHRVVVMYRGRVVEQGTAASVLSGGSHPYTRALVASVPSTDDEPGSRLPTVPEVVRDLLGEVDEETLADPSLTVPDGAVTGARHTPSAARDASAERTTEDATTPLLSVSDLHVSYPGRFGRRNAAVRGVSFDIAPGETFGLVGESGSGKSTVSRVVAGLYAPDSGRVLFRGEDLTGTGGRRGRRKPATGIQMVFQDPYASLNPDRTIGDTIGAGLRFHPAFSSLSREERRDRTAALLTEVGLDPGLATAYPGRLSGGMRQRVGIARALATEPELLIADEPVSALDVSVQAQVLNLLADLQRDRGLALLFISHDLTVVRHMATRVAVMRAGEIVETGDRDQIMERPADDYTRALLEASHSVRRTAA